MTHLKDDLTDAVREPVEHLDQAVAALDLTLDDAEREHLEALYVPHKVLGYH